MAAEGRPLYFTAVISFLFCQHRWKTSHGISTKLGQSVESGVDLQMPHKNFGRKNVKFWTTFLATSAPDTAYLRDETSHRQTKILVSTYNVSRTSWPTFRDLWPRNGWDPLAHCDHPRKIKPFPVITGLPTQRPMNPGQPNFARC